LNTINSAAKGAAFYMAGYGKERQTDVQAIVDSLKTHDVSFHGLTPTGIEHEDPRIISLAAKINAVVGHEAFRQVDQTDPLAGQTEQAPEL
jgi:hypothetical protein